MKHYVIIGGGPTGASAAMELRKNNNEDKITIVSDEEYEYYKRSKIISLISTSCTEEDLFLKGKEIYEKINVNFINNRVNKVLSNKNQIHLDNNLIIPYDSLLIATGGSPIVFPWKGVELEGISTLYDLSDAKKVSESVGTAEKAVIIGGGSIAMKVVSNFKKIGLKTVIIEKASHLWPIGFDRKVARIIENKIKEQGIKIYLNEEVLEFKGKNGRLTSVRLKSKKEIPADLAIITIGMRPNVDFLENRGVRVEKGILVNEYLQTNIENIFAAGDVVQIYDTNNKAIANIRKKKK